MMWGIQPYKHMTFTRSLKPFAAEQMNKAEKIEKVSNKQQKRELILASSSFRDAWIEAGCSKSLFKGMNFDTELFVYLSTKCLSLSAKVAVQTWYHVITFVILSTYQRWKWKDLAEGPYSYTTSWKYQFKHSLIKPIPTLTSTKKSFTWLPHTPSYQQHRKSKSRHFDLCNKQCGNQEGTYKGVNLNRNMSSLRAP